MMNVADEVDDDNEWKPVVTAPDDGREVLACFEGQFHWVTFVARAYAKSHGGVQAAGYAAPDFWKPMPKPPHPHRTR